MIGDILGSIGLGTLVVFIIAIMIFVLTFVVVTLNSVRIYLQRRVNGRGRPKVGGEHYSYYTVGRGVFRIVLTITLLYVVGSGTEMLL